MKAIELRFGNRVLLDGKEVEIDITQMCNFMFWEKNEQDFYPKRWEPIPLTEEWVMELNCPETFLSNDIDGFFVWFNGEKIYIQYVHEMQNLYFALRGNELRPTAA